MDMATGIQIDIDANELIAALSADRSDTREYALDLASGRVVIDPDPAVPDAEERYRRIMPLRSQVKLLVAGDFVDSLPEGYLRQHLEAALQAHAPLDSLEEVLIEYPEDAEAWAAFRRAAYVEAARHWLEDEAIDADLTDHAIHR
jgi:hypothetical protein